MPKQRSFPAGEPSTVVVDKTPLEAATAVPERGLVPADVEDSAPIRSLAERLGLGRKPLSPTMRLVFQSLLVAGLQFGGASTAEAQHRHAHHTRSEREAEQSPSRHHSHHAEANRSTHERAPQLDVHGFEYIGISSDRVRELFLDAWPVFVETHGRIIEIEYINHEGSYVAISTPHTLGPSAQSTPSQNAVSIEDAHYEFRRSGGRIKVFSRSFREVDRTTHQAGNINFQEAMYVIIHEMCHSFTFRMNHEDKQYFQQRMRESHIPFPYPQRFLTEHGPHQPVDYEAMSGEYVAELLSAIYEHAPTNAEPLRAHVADRLALQYPQVSRDVILQDIDRLFGMAPGFDWEAAIGKFRKGVFELGRQFSEHQVRQLLQHLPQGLIDSLPGGTDSFSAGIPLTLGQRFQMDQRLRDNRAVSHEYEQYHAARLDEVTLASTRLQMQVPAFAALKAAWEGLLQQGARLQARYQKNRANMAELAPEWLANGGLSDGAMHGQLQGLLQGMQVSQIAELWQQIPEAQHTQVGDLLRQDASVRLHRISVPPAIALHAEPILTAAPAHTL